MQCYLDDFDAPEIVSEKDASLHIGRPSAALVLRRLANARNGVAISESKAVVGSLATERMGAWVDGKRGRVEFHQKDFLVFVALVFSFWATLQSTAKA